MTMRSVLLSAAVAAVAAVAAAAAATPAAAAPGDGRPDHVMPGLYDGSVCFVFGRPVRDARGNVYESWCDAWAAGAHVAWRLS